MFHKKLDNSRSKKSYSSKKIIGACLIATALTFNVFLSDPTDSSTLRSEPQRTLVTLVDDKTNLSGSWLSGNTFHSISYANAKNIVRRIQQNEDGSQDVFVHYLPTSDILQTDAGVKLIVDLPGFLLNELNAEIRENKTVHMFGNRFNEETNEKEEFDIVFEIDPKSVNTEAISITLENEYLTATAPLKTRKELEEDKTGKELEEDKTGKELEGDIVQLKIVEGPPPLKLIGKLSLEGSSQHKPKREVWEEVIPEPENKTTVFYNVYVHPDTKYLAIDIVNEQMEQIPPEHQVFVRLIGALIDVPRATSIQHDNFGDEIETLGLLWDHCQKHPDERVIYIHSKGSFHAHEKNNILRKFLTRGALSQECLDMPSTCDICSSRMSPVPHVHTSGNMWSTKCDYVQKLINPLEFQAKMDIIYGDLEDAWRVGTGRFASEHWVHSHPSVRSCDLSTEDYTWDYDSVPQGDFEMKLKPAPRFKLKAYEQMNCQLRPLENYLNEYDALYNEMPGDDWWGWKLRER